MNVTFILWLKKRQNEGQRCFRRSRRLPWQLKLLVLLRGQDARPSDHQVVLWVCAAAASLQVRCNAFCAIPHPVLFPGDKPPVSCTALSWAPGMRRGSRPRAKRIALITVFRQCLSCKMTERPGGGQRSCNATFQPPFYSDLRGLDSLV